MKRYAVLASLAAHVILLTQSKYVGTCNSHLLMSQVRNRRLDCCYIYISELAKMMGQGILGIKIQGGWTTLGSISNFTKFFII